MLKPNISDIENFANLNDEQLLDFPTVLALTGTSQPTLHRRNADGAITYVRKGRRVFLTVSDVKKFMRSSARFAPILHAHGIA